jgi:DsbC/DsbD-like thiol-disulfide interchange protein
MKRLPIATALAALSLAAAPPAAAEATRSVSLGAAASPGPVVTGALRPGWQDGGGRRMAGVELRLAPGWKTYWRAPGEAGIPPVFDWAGSQNVAGVRIHWPQPHAFRLNGLQSIGYAGEVVLPLEVTPRDPSRPVRLRARMDLGVCRDVCVPAELAFDGWLEGAGAPDRAIRAALADRPATAREAGLHGLSCTVEPIRDGLRVTATMALRPRGGAEAVVIEPPSDDIWVSDSSVLRQGDRLTAVADLVAGGGSPFALDRGGITVTVLDAQGTVEHRGCPAP